jgi:hypothetical protein
MSLKTRKRKTISETDYHDNEALGLAGIGATDYPELPTLPYPTPGSTLSIVLVITAVHLIYLPLWIAPISFFFNPRPRW